MSPLSPPATPCLKPKLSAAEAPVFDLRLAAVASLIDARMRPREGLQLQEILEAVTKLQVQVLEDVAATTGPIARHHLYADIGPKVLHCVYERVCRQAAFSFYLSDDFAVEDPKEVDLLFVGAYATGDANGN